MKSALFVLMFLLTTGSAVLAQQETRDAEELFSRGDLEASEKAFKQVLKSDKSSTAALLGLTKIAIAREEWQEAGNFAEKILDREPDLTEAHYYYAISHRERAKFRTITQLIHWTKSTNHFEWIIERDPQYRDVLYQFSLMKRYQGKYDEAIEWNERQVSLKPNLGSAVYGLFKVYHHYLHEASAEKAVRYLTGKQSLYAHYALSEALRRKGNLKEADSTAARALREAPAGFTIQPLLLSRARIHYTAQDAVGAEAFVDSAIQSVNNRLEADLVLDDFKYLMSDDELDHYLSLHGSKEFIDFFHSFWAKRDPLPATTVNMRLQEHYRRLAAAEKDHGFYGFRTWHNSPDKFSELVFTRAYRLNREFNDRGFVYIRHGEPNDRVTTVGGAENQNESWRYYGNPQIDFHFERVPDGLGTNSWRLAPRPPAVGRDTWGGIYARTDHSELEAIERSMEMAEKSRSDVLVGITSERHSWPKNTRAFRIPHYAATFRSPDGVPIFELFFELPPRTFFENTSSVEVGFSLHDSLWSVVNEAREKRPVQIANNVGSFQAKISPGSYHAAIHSRSIEQPEYLGGSKWDVDIPEFQEGQLEISDILPARSIEPVDSAGAFVRNGLYVMPAPDLSFSTTEDIFVYFEVYGLVVGADGISRYTVDYTLRPIKGKKRLFGLLGRDDRPVLAISSEHTGDKENTVEYASIDVTRVDPGSYRLTVTIKDLQANNEISRTMPLELVEQGSPE